MIKPIIVIGAGLHGEVVRDAIMQGGGIFSGFLDDNVSGEKILGKITDYQKFTTTHEFILAIGDNVIRKKYFLNLCNEVTFSNVVHPQSSIANEVKIGKGCYIGVNAVINVGSIIGDNTIINSGTIVEHHNKIGNHCHLAPRTTTGGSVTICDTCFLGIGSNVINNIHIVNNTLIGASTLIHKDILEENKKVVGVPFKYLN